MGICRYLAMTAAEIYASQELPTQMAYMACHFSAYSNGLSNCPQSLPENSILILNDRTPICGHNPDLISQQLSEIAEDLHCRAVLLDFQRPDEPETVALVKTVVKNCSCPVGVSDLYAKDLDCPVFLPPAPLTVPLAEHLRPWTDRELWLEAALDAACIRITETDNICLTLPYCPPPENCHTDNALHCCYTAHVTPAQIRFQLYRDVPQLERLLAEAESLGVTTVIGLYQQLHGYI
ncbi:MAG: hypothetical protein J6Q53_08175 [Oscillospiraceae bacterium]|nr:hypothetical protein [Oscillospiraceae bacterium]